ncbi:AbrB/MazE/SpoVT family DNA-binding domain-containing protein [Caldilinea sp.]|uniref:AbrB/MazE/SpoVT family DNA-binding domain-containing protein n=1 Tax=Caldilinea sp. TaxID=2293560 RepID=UPI002BEB2057|nr:AbrB/MazE/SpoVT family DNA-binding domain-containing protein [Anaerolineales bacterium]HQY91541.1 AbrB/MazE/SpoVT family DNA-binding domain-containing protein [Caldilinea sp.]HRA66716.1 AbrB/MazE/SpoVT family DNA-binding domain-containing protein [Caldilinea sp.]
MMDAYTIRIRERGQVTIPQVVRERMAVKEGDTLTLFQVDDLILLATKQLLIPQLSEQFSALMDAEGVTLADLLIDLRDERQTSRATRPAL